MPIDFRRRSFGVFPVLAAIFAFAGCSGSNAGHNAYGQGDPNLAAPNPGGGPIDPFLTDGHAVIRALDAIAQKSGRPLRVTSINVDGVNGLSVNVQEPKHPMNVDHYVVAPDGTITGPAPVKLMSLDGGPITVATVDARAFDPNAIAFVRLTQTARQAIAKSGYSDARVTQWEIDGIGHDDRHFMYLESARARPSANIDSHLNIIGMSF